MGVQKLVNRDATSAGICEGLPVRGAQGFLFGFLCMVCLDQLFEFYSRSRDGFPPHAFPLSGRVGVTRDVPT